MDELYGWVDALVSGAKAKVDEPDIVGAISLARDARRLLADDRSPAANDVYVRAALVESTAWHYRDDIPRADSTARAAELRAQNLPANSRLRVDAAIRRCEVLEVAGELNRAARGYWRLVNDLSHDDRAAPQALVCCYQLVACGTKDANPMLAESFLDRAERLLRRVEDSDLEASHRHLEFPRFGGHV